VSVRTTLILLALAVGLGAYVWFGEIQAERRAAEEAAQQKKLVGTPRERWTRLELETSDGATAQLARGEGEGAGWSLVAPVAYPVDASTVDRALDALEKLAFESEIQPVPADLAPFGLGDPARRVALSVGEGEPVVIQLGGHTPVGSARYLTLSTHPGRIYTAPYASTAALEPSLLDLRDKRIADLDPARVRTLSVRTDGQVVELARDDEGAWRVTTPLSDRADSERVDRLLEDLQLARASGFVDQPAALKDYGLDPPEVELHAGWDGGGAQVQLGRAGDKYYARAGEGGPVFEVRERLLTGVPREVFEYRYKQVLALDESLVRQLVLSFPRESETWRLRRQENQWLDEDPGLEVDALKVSDLVYALESLEATGAEEGQVDRGRLGLEPPRVRVSALAEDGRELGWLELGDPHPARGLPARASAAPERIWRVEVSLGEEVPLSPDALRTNFARRVEEAAAGEPEGEAPVEEEAPAAGAATPQAGAPPGAQGARPQGAQPQAVPAPAPDASPEP
jgi:hypothetical protein